MPAPLAGRVVLDSATARLESFKRIWLMFAPVPEEWLHKKGGKDQPAAKPLLSCLPCESYASLINAWRKAMQWTEGLDYALSAMLASVTSTRSVGSQLWLKVMGPASCGKTTLCEAINVADKYVISKSTIRGFHSGWQREGGENASLIDLVRDKTLVTKDGDTLLQSPNLGQILAEARDIYDSTSRSHFKNGAGQDHTGVRMTWLLCGTSSLHAIDSSELGERFLNCYIMEGIDDDLEDEILWRVANRADRNMAIESNGSPDTQYDPDMVAAMRLTGGYVNYLRENASALLGAITIPDPSKRKITRLGKFVAYMRAKPSKIQTEHDEREFAARLVEQHVRLAKCLAAVMNRSTVDEQVMERVQRVSMDTCRGKTLKIVERLYVEDDGLEPKSLAMFIGEADDKVKTLLRFLRRIGVVDIVEVQTGRGTARRFALTDLIRRVYTEVMA